MRILFATTRLTYAGAPKMMAWIANQMAAKGHEVHLVTFYSEEQARLLHENVKMISLRVTQSRSRLVRNTTGMLKTLGRLHKLVLKLKPDVVVTFLDSVGYVYLPIGRLFTKTKIVASERVDPYAHHGKTAAVRFALMNFAHGTVFQTDGARNFFENRKRVFRNSTVIPNPVVTGDKILAMQKSIPAYKDRDKTIVTVGRLSLRQKRQDVLLDAFKLFLDKNPGYTLVMYGDGPDRAKIQAMIEARGLTGKAVLAGRTDRVEEMIFHAAAFVLTSDYEGIPNALIEAMSIGVPSVSTDCSPGGAALLIRDGENGYLVPCGDAKAIAEKLSLVVNEAHIAERFSKNSPSITSEFAEAVIAEKWETYFQKVTGNKERV